jgi:hypothetical protein
MTRGAAYCRYATLEGVLGTGQLLKDSLAFYPDNIDSIQSIIADISMARAKALK